MKKLLLIVCFLIVSISLKAQVTTTLDTINNVDKLIKPLNKSTFTTNILYDRVVPIANLTDFNSTANNISDLKHFEQALSELYRASKKSKFNTIEVVRQQYASLALKNKVDIGVINSLFNQVNYNDNDNSKGALQITNNVLVPINNKPIFLQNEVLIIAPLKEYAVGQTVFYNFKNALIFEETTKKIVKLTANFDSQNTHTIINNGQLVKQNVGVNYTTSGYKTLTFTVTYNDGSSKTTKGKLYVTATNNNLQHKANDGIEEGGIKATIPFTGYEPDDVPILGQLEYRIFYHGTPGNYEKVLKKPIVIIDGFDPFDTRKIQESDYPNDGEEYPDAIETLMSYENDNNETKYLIPKLRELGYDVVIVNHPVYEDIPSGKTIDGGADYIERNAMAHIALYQYLNNTAFTNGSSEKLTIMGPSMGGQISRYALAYMEEHNLNHNTKLWVSIDSPHLGANIPMATQANLYFLGYVHGNQEAKDKFDFLLNSPTGKQQLILQFLNDTSSPQSFFQRYHTNLESNLPSFKGFPQLPRNIAIANGSANNFVNTPGKKVLDIRGFADFLWFSVKGFQNEQWLIKNTGQTNKIFFGEVDKVFSGYSMSSTFTNALIYGSLDALQGGTENSQGEIKVEVEKELNELVDDGTLDRVHIYEFIPNHTFIPTVSSLAFKNSNFNWGNNINRDLVCTNEIPFDTYYTPENNEKHVSFTQKSIDWLLDELNGVQQSPRINKNLNQDSLLGDLAVCNNKTNTYTLDIPNSCSGLTVTWSTSSNIQIQSSNNNSITVTAIDGTNSASGYIKAYIQEKDVYIDKFVWVGIPGPNFLSISILGSYNFYANNWTKLKVIHPIPPLSLVDNDPTYGLTYQWSVPNSFTRNFNDTSIIDVKPFSTGQLNIGVKMQNQCGCTDYKYQLFNVTNQYSGGFGGGFGGGPVLTIDPGN
ncbi:esterase/lipase family protein [Polaribacter sp.]|uniref:esterase/lipase family protein n=1 Tax=Polaribacter sp. TaxID=1920175 RepID=UPI003F6B5788